jgi:Ca-activated chloride channel family protein
MRCLSAICLVAALLAPAAVWSEGRSIIVLDASGSMWGEIDGRAKLEIAREALGTVVAGLDPATEIGLMAYGHREKGVCEDIELVVPPAPGTGKAIIDAANAMQFIGMTPLTESVRRAAVDLRSTEQKATVILITDGIETCDADPCALGVELEASGVDFTAHVVGFGLTEEEGQSVACLADNTGGKYIQASDAGQLVEALKTTVAVVEPEPVPEPAPEPAPPPAPAVLAENVDPVVLFVAGGPEVGDPVAQDVIFSLTPIAADGSLVGDPITIYGRRTAAVPEGRYQMVTELHRVRVEQVVEIGPASALSTPTAVLNAGILDLTLRPAAGAEPDPDAFWELTGAAGAVDAGYAKGYRVVPAGDYVLSAKLGAAEKQVEVLIEAGAISILSVVIGTGLAVVETFYVEGMMVEGTDHFTEILAAKKAMDGSRPVVAYGYGAGASFDLPEGDFVAFVTLGKATAEAPFTVKVGERVDVALTLNAGVAAVTAGDTNTFVEVFKAKPNIDGNRASVAYGYGPTWQSALPAGDYIAVVDLGSGPVETPFTVVAGERVEVAPGQP